jgi:homoserine dehydrogenase
MEREQAMLRLALIGFGTVGQGTVEILHTRAADLWARYGFAAQVVAVATRSRGSLYAPDGLNLDELLKAGNLNDYPDQPGLQRNLSPLDIIKTSNADAIIEISPTDLQTGEPALTHCRAAFEAKKSVIVANKGPVALAFHELREAAKAKNLFFGYEGVVMGGTPSLRLARQALAGCSISAVRGILNGTTNFILTAMESGQTYEVALAEAQRRGYAETDPSGDVEGHDAAGKLSILTTIVLNKPLSPAAVQTQGITGITEADIQQAREVGEHWKLIASAQVIEGEIVAKVAPVRLSATDPLAGVSGINNAVTYTTDLLGDVTLIGPGAGRTQTGFAILSDLLEMDDTRKRVAF